MRSDLIDAVKTKTPTDEEIMRECERQLVLERASRPPVEWSRSALEALLADVLSGRSR
jgi:hypothetical protein